jgi:hypothetical protein
MGDSLQWKKRINRPAVIIIFLGPVTPAYPEVCCAAFTTGHVCEENFDNAIAGVPNVDNVQTCQQLCQVRQLPNVHTVRNGLMKYFMVLNYQ